MNKSISIRAFKGINPELGKRVYIDPQSCLIGDVVLGDDCNVWPMAVIRADMHKIRIGARVSVQDGAVLHITHASDYNPEGFPLLIGNDVIIGHKACLHGCTLGSRILIGISSIVMDGAVIQDDVVLGANSFVPSNKVLESGFLYVGSPAKKARELSDKEKAFLQYSPQNYVKLKDEYLAQ